MQNIHERKANHSVLLYVCVSLWRNGASGPDWYLPPMGHQDLSLAAVDSMMFVCKYPVMALKAAEIIVPSHPLDSHENRHLVARHHVWYNGPGLFNMLQSVNVGVEKGVVGQQIQKCAKTGPT